MLTTCYHVICKIITAYIVKLCGEFISFARAWWQSYQALATAGEDIGLLTCSNFLGNIISSEIFH